MSTPASPVEVGFFDTLGIAKGVAVSGSYAYVADFDAGLRVIDVSTPANPIEVGFVDTPGYASRRGRLRQLRLRRGWLFRSASYRRVDARKPDRGGLRRHPGVAYSVAVSGSYAYVADYYHGLRVIDVSTPARPIEVGWVGTPGYAYGVAVSGRYAFVAANYVGLYVIDVELPSAPIAVGIL